jgi:hypothetical protein
VKLNDKMKSRIHLITDIAISAMLVILGILFICSCYSIYKSGASPFTRESIGEAFARIAIPTYVTVSLVIIGAAVNVLIPKDEPKLRGKRTLKLLVDGLAKKVDIDSLDSEIKAKIEKERKSREVLLNVRATLLAVAAILPLFVLIDPTRFPAESGRYNAEILHGMLLYLAFLAPVAIFEVVWVIYSDKSLARENEALKEAIKANGVSDKETEEHNCLMCRTKKYFEKNSKPVILGVRIALLGCAILLIVLGVINGGMADVLNKAIKICTECIGLG